MVLGIVLCAVAGRRRERELSAKAQQVGGSGFWLGLVICILSGVFSPMLNFSFVFGKSVQRLALDLGAKPAMASNPVWALMPDTASTCCRRTGPGACSLKRVFLPFIGWGPC
ncbi:MAG: hypothetical protein DMG24_12505 [Acidobacteria bacterium]|nr:MAG: hypothetical protein DMG24_12505 [Acidobacteriota bacterium]